MESNQIAQRLRDASEVVAMGNRPVEDRPVFSLMGLQKFAKVIVLAGVLAASAVGLTAAYNPGGVLHGPEQTTSALVVAKVHQNGGAKIPTDRAGGQVEAWQPQADAEGSEYRLMLSVDGNTVQVPVSKSVYDNYCQQANIKAARSANRFDTNNPARVLDCEPGQVGQAPETIKVSYARNTLSGDIEITRFGTAPKAATSFLERYQLRKESKEQFRESQDVNFIHRGPPMG